ncbi:dTDP-glucose 4,6-dehydratase [Mesorhizobium loti]|nr:NAD(P)-dependent oxidoreductase [Mesorhizobium loti]PLP56719.1 dTDP-glucose 4,6-dehydratase [Mesorhizobium loti]
MGRRILLAGATGAVGQRLTPMLLEAGHLVSGTTRSATKAAVLQAVGANAVVVDVFDSGALAASLLEIRPEIVIHQLTDLPSNLDPALMGEAIIRNARIRDEGTRNLIEAARQAGTTRLIAQSIAWAYAPGPLPHDEQDPLDIAAEGPRAISMNGVIALERRVLEAPMHAIVLRYGQFYGPGTGFDAPKPGASVHIDAAAYAALLAVDRGTGVYNVAEANDQVSTDRAIADLGWHADFRRSGT